MIKKMSIAIDGPAGSGKSTVAKIIARRLGFLYIDTGAMYRAFTLKALQTRIDLHDERALYQLLQDTLIRLKTDGSGQEVFLDDENVTVAIRSAEVNAHVSIISGHKTIRLELVRRQRLLGDQGGVVMDGRDIGTVVLPNAEVKVFLVASAEVRARRRYQENRDKQIPTGSVEQLIEEINRRDHLDSTRDESPLVQADGAVRLDTTTLSIEQVVDQIIILADQKSI